MVRIRSTKRSKYETLKMRIGLVISNDVIKKYEVKELYNLFKAIMKSHTFFRRKKTATKNKNFGNI